MTHTIVHIIKTTVLCAGLLVGWAAGSDPEAWSSGDAAQASPDAAGASYSSAPTAPRLLQKP